MQAVRQFLLEERRRRAGAVTILNVACGPSREYTEGFVPTREEPIRLIAVDNDPAALDYVRSHVVPVAASQIQWELVQYNALRMTSPRRNVENFGRPDIIYSVGLCDYLSDRVLVPLLQAWRESLSEDGVVYVAFKDATRYETAEYQWLLDWFFLQRTEADCRGLFAAAGYDMDQLELSRDETGVILVYVGHAAKSTAVRIDDAEQRIPIPHTATTREPQDESIRRTARGATG
jgi:hypothetical protein